MLCSLLRPYARRLRHLVEKYWQLGTWRHTFTANWCLCGYGFTCVPKVDAVSDDVLDVDVNLPLVGSETKLVPNEKESFLGKVAAGVQVVSVPRGPLFNADVSEDVCLEFFVLEDAAGWVAEGATAFGK